MKPVGKYLGNGRIELNDYGLSIILSAIKKGEVISEKKLLKRVNKNLRRKKNENTN